MHPIQVFLLGLITIILLIVFLLFALALILFFIQLIQESLEKFQRKKELQKNKTNGLHTPSKDVVQNVSKRGRRKVAGYTKNREINQTKTAQ